MRDCYQAVHTPKPSGSTAASEFCRGNLSLLLPVALNRLSPGGRGHPTEMKVVSENSDDDLKRRQADGRVGTAVRALAANLMRVTRGSGKAQEIGSQAHELIEARMAYAEAWGFLPGPDRYDEYLDIAPNAEIMSQISEEDAGRIYAKAGIVRASLQIAASGLLGQRTQETIADHDLYTAIRELEAGGTVPAKAAFTPQSTGRTSRVPLACEQPAQCVR